MTKKNKKSTKPQPQEYPHSLEQMAQDINEALIASGSTDLGEIPPIPPGQSLVTFVPGERSEQDDSQDE